MTEVFVDSLFNESFFLKKIGYASYTENGALSHSLIDPELKKEGIMGLFYKSIRDIDYSILDQYLKKASKEDTIMAIIITFYIRDCRGGKGERTLGRYCFKYFATNHKDQFIKVLKEIPEYGRWDDLIMLIYVEDVKHMIFDILSDRLKEDMTLMNSGKPVSLCAKWMPTENHRIDKLYKFVRQYTKYHKISIRTYRTMIISPLRKYIDIVERKLCAKDYINIDYSKVPSCTMHKLAKAFKKNDEERFSKWKSDLAKGTNSAKVNAGQLFPYEIIRNYMFIHNDINELYEAQWKQLVKDNSGIYNNSLVVCDVSGSMCNSSNSSNPNIRPIDVAISLGILIAENAEEPFKNRLITFTKDPEFINIENKKTLLDKIRHISKAPWGMNTDLQKTFDVILTVAKFSNTLPENMIKRLYIISDMQFDIATNNTSTNFKSIKEKFRNAGYKLPQIIFWNVAGCDDVPVTIHETGTALISGFSPSIMKYISADDITPWTVVLDTLNNERYSRLKALLR